MDRTLVQRLQALDNFKVKADQLGVEFTREDLRSKRDEEVKYFYAKNPLAFAVSENKDSYVERVKPVIEKYDSFWKRVLPPRYDREFDEDACGVIKSMNEVGSGFFDIKLLTTKGRRRDVLTPVYSGGVVGIIISGAVGSTSSDPYFAGAAAFAISGVCLPALSLLGNKGPFEMNIFLRELGEVAHSTDDYLGNIGKI